MIKIKRPQCPDPERLKTDYRADINKLALIKASCDKCMYCESKVTDIYPGDVEHIRPKSKYPAEEFIWENLGFACWRCNNSKRNRYDDENPFINPYDDDPSDHFCAAGTLIFGLPGDIRADYTWKAIDLNRAQLAESRRERVLNLQRSINEYLNAKDGVRKEFLRDTLISECAEDKEYSFILKDMLNRYGI